MADSPLTLAPPFCHLQVDVKAVEAAIRKAVAEKLENLLPMDQNAPLVPNAEVPAALC